MTGIDVGGEQVRAASAGGTKYFASLGRSLVIGTCSVAAGERGQHVVGAVPGGDHDRAGDELAGVGAAPGPARRRASIAVVVDVLVHRRPCARASVRRAASR